MPGPRDSAGEVFRGVTEACLHNDHLVCRDPRCGCDCHAEQRRKLHPPSPTVDVTSAPTSLAPPALICPKCNGKRPAGEKFCRIDGSRLLSLLCGHCGKVFSVGDQFCWFCGNAVIASEQDMREAAEVTVAHELQQLTDEEEAKLAAGLDMEREAVAAMAEEARPSQPWRPPAPAQPPQPGDGKMRAGLPKGAIKEEFGIALKKA